MNVNMRRMHFIVTRSRLKFGYQREYTPTDYYNNGTSIGIKTVVNTGKCDTSLHSPEYTVNIR